MAALIDAHCHRVLAGDLDRAAFERACTEADLPAPAGVSYVDGQLGLAVRRWCSPALGLPAHAPVKEYLERRAAYGWRAATGTLMHAAGLTELLVDTGLDRADLVDDRTFAQLCGARVREVVRLERVAELMDCGAGDFASTLAETLHARTRGAAAVKSIIAYRHGLHIPPERPSAAEVTRAAGEWLRGGRGRLTDPVLLRHILWSGVDLGLPLQLHTGFGDRVLALRHADPALLQPFLAALDPNGPPIVLLHCYPYHRQAGWLAQVFPRVHVDLGLTIGHLGVRGDAVLGEFLELAPFGKVLFSTDAYLLPELYLVGVKQFRHGLRKLLDGWRADDALSAADAARLEERLTSGNARRVYG
ncbi:amidohydrolase [Virgisporangium aliadipatigenens]|uniref:Amidohydrolase n=1 Tax=Virgisporangium aliadipatigenens TaxID=741659 RepID=A0A8J3YFQ7_9ACTN|nr:amidohydrolase family protein [Virgisporangium aliadipatigenens]GIJ44369.1 amidohydrolase [Virgisporangium aliadipatigenens]